MPDERAYDHSLNLYDEALTLIPGGAQTTSKRPTAFALGAYPVYFDRAEGCRITDIDGNTYIDLVGALGPISLGYQYPAVDEAIRAQLGRGIIAGLNAPVEVEVARLLRELVPGAEMSRFFKGGGEATAAAARLARRATDRQVIVNAGYRGWPDVWSAGLDPGVPTVLASTIERFELGDREPLEALVMKHRGQIAAIAVDVSTEWPGDDYLPWLRDLCDEIGALLVFDEIVTGFRLARGGLQEYSGVTPDLAVFAKGIANGMPLAALTGRAEVMRELEGALVSITYGGEALSLAAARATLATYRDEPVVETLHARGKRLREGLTAAAADVNLPFEVVGFDPMTAMRFVELDPALERDAWGYVLQEMAGRGVLLRRGGLNFVSYSHSDADIDAVVAAARDVFDGLSPLVATGGDAVRDKLRIRSVDTGFRSFTWRSS
jgi:glutamate-1-semialdehyde aminotransferase